MKDKSRKNQEIERKFLVQSIPSNLSQLKRLEIEQGYIDRFRFRKQGDKYFQTLKFGQGKVRTEIQIKLTKIQFLTFWSATENQRLSKTRYLIPYGKFLIELDLYHGKLEGFVSAEVEFSSIYEADKFKVPEWFGKEVTDDNRYSNRSLATEGLPK